MRQQADSLNIILRVKTLLFANQTTGLHLYQIILTVWATGPN